MAREISRSIDQAIPASSSPQGFRGFSFMTKEHDQSRPDPAHPVDGAMSEDEIDRNLEESFPASDPPSWTLGTNHKEAPASEPDADPPQSGEGEA
jgi:hypothetical protein